MHIFTLKSTKRITPNTLLLTLQPKRNKDKLDFYPGQYAAIGFKQHGRPSPVRCFSIVSSPNKPDELQFAMRVYGDFTNAVAELETGTTVFVYGPFGNFIIDEQYDKNVILLAGGIGVTPFMSMIRYAAEAKVALPITLLYSCPTQDNIPFYEELLELEQKNPKFKTVFFVTNDAIDRLEGSRALAGRMNETRLNRLTNRQYNRFTYFICGPKGFTRSMTSILADNDTDPFRIITEEFTPTSQVSNISAASGHSIPRWTYALTGISMVLATAFIMTIDLDRAVPRLVSAQTVQQPTTTTQTTTPINPASSSTSPSQTSSATNSQSTDTPTSDQSTSTSTPTTTAPSSSSSSTANNSSSNNSSTQQTYQPPVTSVS